MDVYQKIGKDLAKANLQVAKAIGQVIGFQHRDELPVPLRVYPIERNSDNIDKPMGNRINQEKMQFLMPTQGPAFASGVSGFSGTWNVQPATSGLSNQPANGDWYEFPLGSSTYWVIDGEIKVINHGWTYVVGATQRATINLGEKS
jgi:hypothetical protein